MERAEARARLDLGESAVVLCVCALEPIERRIRFVPDPMELRDLKRPSFRELLDQLSALLKKMGLEDWDAGETEFALTFS